MSEPMSRGNILILDDEAEIGSFLAKVVEACGFTPFAMTEISAFQNNLGQYTPAYIFLDLQMPGVDGIEVLRWLAEQQSQASIVIMSGFDQKVIETARRLGLERGLRISGTMQKPFRVEDVAALLGGFGQPVTSNVIDSAAIEAALSESQFRLAYQPKMELCKGAAALKPLGSMAGFEALLRWQHPQRGLLTPDHFLDVAMNSGLMNRITDTVFDMALLQQQEWAANGYNVSVAVNVSAHSMGDASFADRLKSKCDLLGCLPDSIIIELTETTAMGDPVTAMDILTRLRIKGFRLAIDDFGSGYSSLVQLQMLPFSELKIDRAFVRDCNQSRQSRVIVKTMIDLAHNLDLTCVAEGVETEAQLALLREFGCDMIQGYLVSKPLLPEAATQWLHDTK